MAPRLHFLLACIVGVAVGQICNCPLVGVITTTSTLPCPTGDVFTVSSVSTVGACRNPRTKTTTTTSTVGACSCPTQTTVTETATPTCTGVTSTSTAIEPTIDCPWAATATRTITQYGSLTTTNPFQTTGRTAASTGIVPARTSPSRPQCSLADLPESFYIRNPLSGYLTYDPSCRKAVGCPYKADAVPFHVNNTDDFDLSGIPQLSIYYPPHGYAGSEEYGAYVDYNGGPIQFFRAGEVPEQGDWFIVTASFSTYLCRLSLITWNLHDLSTPEDCYGYLSLGSGFGEDECPETRLYVEPA